MGADGAHFFILFVVVGAALLVGVNETCLLPLLAVHTLLGLLLAKLLLLLLQVARLEGAVLRLAHTLAVVESGLGPSLRCGVRHWGLMQAKMIMVGLEHWLENCLVCEVRHGC